MRGLIVLVVVANVMHHCIGEGDFPPPPMPRRPPGFNLYCDVCKTMVKRAVPYCERDDENLDFLPDFCVFNYNKVLRTECDYMVDVMEYVWCPNACAEMRHLKTFAPDRICHNHFVNCTERAFTPSPSPSPSPSSSMALPHDCVLCEFVLKYVAVMCMNDETANKRKIYQACMEKTHTKEDFEHCMVFLNQLVVLAGTEDPCTMLSCTDPKATCQMDFNSGMCHVAKYDGPPLNVTNIGLDQNGNLLDPSSNSAFARTEGLGPGDFKPGVQPFHSRLPIVQRPVSPSFRLPGQLVLGNTPTIPVTPDAIKQAQIDQLQSVKAMHQQTAQQAAPTPIPLQDVVMKL